jgi:hypothetical protein
MGKGGDLLPGGIGREGENGGRGEGETGRLGERKKEKGESRKSLGTK